MEKTILLLLLLLIIPGLKAQEVISSSGETNTLDSVILSWTLGETITETGFRSEGENSLTQGFQQGKLTVTAINENESNAMHFSVLPNPTSDFVNLIAEDFTGLEYQLFNINSKMIAKEKLQGTTTKIDLTSNSAGSYLLLILKNNQKLLSYQIIKK